MAQELMASAAGDRRGLILDPRTKIFLLIFMIACFLSDALGQGGRVLLLFLTAVPFILLLSSRRWKGAAEFAALYIAVYLTEIFILPRMSEGFWFYLLFIICSLIGRFMPCIMMGYFMVTTTTVSEFIASMERMHITDKVTIPLSVLFRFFPTVMEEMHAIRDAMNMRGIRLFGKHPDKVLEYRIVPLLICSVKTGDELSAASLTRCLGGPVKRTNICRIGFHFQDYAAFALCIVLLAVSIMMRVYG